MAFRPRASTLHCCPLPGHSSPVRRALVERRSEPGEIEPNATRATGLRRTHTARSLDAPEAGDTEKFTLEVADRIGGDQGDFLYFQLATSLICGCGDEPNLSWPRIKRGFEASERQYGVSMLNLNQIAFLASRYGELDPVMADKAMARIGEQWHDETWKNKEAFETTKKWAASYAPAAAKLHAMEEDAKRTCKHRKAFTTWPLSKRRTGNLCSNVCKSKGAFSVSSRH